MNPSTDIISLYTRAHILYTWYFNRSIIAVPFFWEPNLGQELIFVLFCFPINFHLPHRKLILFVGYRVSRQMYVPDRIIFIKTFMLIRFHCCFGRLKKHPYARCFGSVQWFKTFNKSSMVYSRVYNIVCTPTDVFWLRVIRAIHYSDVVHWKISNFFFEHL